MLHAHLRELMAAYRVIPTLCAPRSGNQNGSEVRLVGYAKKSFFFARRFRDRADVEAQLVERLHEVNPVRPSDATGVVPAAARKDEEEWLTKRPVQTAAAEHPIRVVATITPMGTISFEGTPCFATARRIGAPATLLVRQDTRDIVVGDERCTHRRVDGVGVVQRLPAQRQDMLAAIHGKRKIATFRRECLLELGQPAWALMTMLVHECPNGRWEEPCTELYEILDEHGAEELCAAFTRCVLSKRFTVDAVRRRCGRSRERRQRRSRGRHRRLNLATVARLLPEYETRAAKEGWSHQDFLALRLAEEVAHRTNTRVNKLARYAHFPYLKTIEEFDFVLQSTLRRQALGPYLGPELVTEGRNLILSGKPGRGKTRLAIALACRAIQNGFEARFVTAHRRTARRRARRHPPRGHRRVCTSKMGGPSWRVRNLEPGAIDGPDE